MGYFKFTSPVRTDNIKVYFNLAFDDTINLSCDSVLNKPIIINERPVGIITEAILDNSGLSINCKGVIWDMNITHSFSLDSKKYMSLEIR
jgi:hypothetical protein